MCKILKRWRSDGKIQAALNCGVGTEDGSTQLHRWNASKAVTVWGTNNIIGVAPCLACCRHPTCPEWVCELKFFNVSTIIFCWRTHSLFLRCLALGVCWGREHGSGRNKSHLTLRHVWNLGPNMGVRWSSEASRDAETPRNSDRI